MRPGQNKRMRGRNNNNNNNGTNNRRGPNPLTRSYESNGPDVKIRGTAHHVAEKYLQLARDSQTSGDPVAAESYLQHAEHYFRLIASAQQAQAGYARQPDEADNDEADDDDVSAMPDRFASPPERIQAFVPPPPAPPQPAYQERQPYQGDRQPYNGERQGYQNDRQPNPERNGQEVRVPQENRSGQDRNNYDRQGRNDRQQRQPRPYRDQDQYRQDGQNRQDNRGQDYRNREPRQDYQAGEARDGGRVDQNGREPQRDTAVRPETFRPEPPRNDSTARDTPREPPPAERQPDIPRPSEPVRETDAALPAFITAPVRVAPPPVAMPAPELPLLAAVPSDMLPPVGEAADEVPRFPVRRRRRTRAAIAADLEAAAAGRTAAVPTGDE